ncbi:MAG: sigma-54 dependent transcriptional regulator [Blastocatellia bacterium]|nr:sigma-54 dependent transcriptional regulator [Blastocatellia bacterium]
MQTLEPVETSVEKGRDSLSRGDIAGTLASLWEALTTYFAEPSASDEATRRAVAEEILNLIRVTLDHETVRRVWNTGSVVPEGQTLRSLPEFLTLNAQMRQILAQIIQLRHSRTTVLITGESGVGKELIARAIHLESNLREGPYIPFNCAAVEPELLESRLFGHRKGSFTGAVSDQRGVVRAAEGGTLFLDEVGELSLEVQPKLLRFLQEGEVQPIGDDRPTKVKVRVVAATNQLLETMVAAGKFREDLFHRLNVIRLRVPPLRERREEILPLAEQFLRQLAERERKQLSFSEETRNILQNYHWPGNIRQLRNEMERVAAYAENWQVVTPDLLSEHITRYKPPITKVSAPTATEGKTLLEIPNGTALQDIVDAVERHVVENALQRNKFNISRTSRQLGVTRKGLYIKCERLGIALKEKD